MHWPGRPPSVDTLQGTPQAWVRLGREDAVRFCRTLPVAVAYLNLGQWVSAWLSPESPFYHASGPYDYASLRYFLFGGSRTTGTAGGGGGGRSQKDTKDVVGKEKEPVPAEAFESWEETADEAAIAPLAKISSLATRPGLPKPPPLLQTPVLQTPGLPSGPELPGLPEVPELPGIPVPEKLPIEIRLVDALGKPMADARYSLLLPDRSRQQGKSDASGFIRLPDNTLPGEVELVLEGLA